MPTGELVTCKDCGAEVKRPDVRIARELEMTARGQDPTPAVLATYCPACAAREYPQGVPGPACATCGKMAPLAEHWPDGWIGVGIDGSILYPVAQGAFIVAESLSPSGSNEAVCSQACLRALRGRREAAVKSGGP